MIFRCVVKRSRTWALTATVCSVYPWLDLRLSELASWTKPFFVSVELELGFWCKQTAHDEDSSVSAFELSSLTIVHPSHDISDVLLSGHVHGRWQQLVRSSIHDLIWDCRNCFMNKTLFFVAVELELGFWCKQTAYCRGFLSPWLDLRLSELLAMNKTLFVSVELELGFWCKTNSSLWGFCRFLFWTVILTIVHPSHDISDVLLSGHVHGRWQQLFVRLSMTWFEIVGELASWTKPFFVSVELELGFWCKQTAYYEDSLSPWLDLRLSELLHETKPFFGFCWIGARFLM